ncbi:MAG TPA: hypothetical protein VE573_04615 [Nitrososphaeraceae archaeon]|jgi:hypothetical protein|nr:hypothetical protein [Nitrososphaeraceae archaeon]
MTKAFVCGPSIIHMGKVPPQQTVIVMTAAIVTIVMWISTLAIVIPQAAYAQQDEINPSPLSSLDVDDNCASDQLPARIDGTIRCMDPGECYSSEFEFDGEKVKHCNY